MPDERDDRGRAVGSGNGARGAQLGDAGAPVGMSARQADHETFDLAIGERTSIARQYKIMIPASYLFAHSFCLFVCVWGGGEGRGGEGEMTTKLFESKSN